MPDISMCADDECPSRAECYRHKESGTKPHVPWQAFTDFQRQHDRDQCPFFCPVLHTKRASVVKTEQNTE
jgi:hypothetical protein